MSNTNNSIGNFNANNKNNNNNMMSAQMLSQGGVGIFNPLVTQQQQQQGIMNGIIGNSNLNMTNAQAGSIANNMNSINVMNNMNGMMNNINYANGNGNFNVQQSIQANMNQNAMSQNANFNNFNVDDFMRLQQQLQQQQQVQQQIQQQQIQQQQIQQQQLQVGSTMSNQSPQNVNLALLAAQQNQNLPNNNASNNNFLQSFIGRNPQFAGGNGLMVQGQGNAHQNPFLGHLMTQQQGGIGAVGAVGLVGQNHGGMNVPSMIGSANNFQLPSPNTLFSRDASRRMRGGVIEPFPEKLHRLLLEVEAAGRADVISFVANGRAFAIHKADNFFKEIVPLYFRQSRLSSFKRQLNLYGFELINTGPARGGYYHEMFVKERPELCRRMRRVAVKVIPSKDSTAKKKIKNKNPDTYDSKPLDAGLLAIKAEEEVTDDAETVEAAESCASDDGEQAIKGTEEGFTVEKPDLVSEQTHEENAEQTTITVTEKVEENQQKGTDGAIVQSGMLAIEEA